MILLSPLSVVSVNSEQAQMNQGWRLFGLEDSAVRHIEVLCPLSLLPILTVLLL